MLRKILSWKYGIIVAFILLATFWTARKDKEAREQYEQKCAQLNASTMPPASSNKDCDKGADDAARHLPLRYHIFGWPEGITVWAILLTLFAIAEQTNQTRRSAEVSSKQLDRMVESERARLVVQPTQLRVESDPESTRSWYLRVRVEVSNIGVSRAFDIKGKASLWVQDSSSPIRHENIFPWQDEASFRISAEPGTYVIHVDSQIPQLTLSKFSTGIESGRVSIYFQGVVEYETLGVIFRRDYSWHWISDGGQGAGIRSGDHIMRGQWYEEESQKNGERQAPPR